MYRKVMFSEREDKPRINKGYFHEWGMMEVGYIGEEKDVSCAIIEDIAGNVHTLRPFQIKFVEQWES